MRASVDEVALRFRLPRGSQSASAKLPALERLLQTRLAAELEEVFDTTHDAGNEVIVVREALASVSLRADDHVLDQSTLRRVSAAARDAVLRLMQSTTDDELVRRYPSDAAYAGEFVLELLGGTAWERWWFAQFTHVRRASARDTIVALLAQADTECNSLFAWLEQRGRLADVLAVIGPTTARQFALSEAVAETQPQPAELAPLSDAAFAIAEALGTYIARPHRRLMLEEYRRMRQDLPSWRDRNALTAWVLELAQWLMHRDQRHTAAAARDIDHHDALRELLAGPLVWLSGEWILERVRAVGDNALNARDLPARRHEPSLAAQHSALLREMASLVARGGLRLEVDEPHDQLLLRLLAAVASDTGHPGPVSATLVAVLDDVLAAFAQRDSRGSTVVVRTPSVATADDIPAARTRSPAAIGLLDALIAQATPQHASSPLAGVFLLVRPIADLRLHRLAERAGVPIAPLLAALLQKLLGATPPWDDAARIWFGSPMGSDYPLDAIPLHSLQALLLTALAGQQHLDPCQVAVHNFSWRGNAFVALSDRMGSCWPLAASADVDAEAELLKVWGDAGTELPGRVSSERGPTDDLAALHTMEHLSPEVDVLITSIATCILRAMSRWLPGLAGASVPFLMRNCIARSGTVVVSEEQISITLAHSPLDVVLEMAGAFATVPRSTWLGRPVRLAVDHAAH